MLFRRQSSFQPRLADRAQNGPWLTGARLPDFPTLAVLRVAASATMRQACAAAGINPDGPLVGIMASAFYVLPQVHYGSRLPHFTAKFRGSFSFGFAS